MEISATDAKNRLGQVLEVAQREAVIIGKSGRRHSVVISHDRYEQLLKAEAGESPASAKRRFAEKHAEWIAAEHEDFAKNGLWNEDLRLW